MFGIGGFRLSAFEPTSSIWLEVFYRPTRVFALPGMFEIEMSDLQLSAGLPVLPSKVAVAEERVDRPGPLRTRFQNLRVACRNGSNGRFPKETH